MSPLIALLIDEFNYFGTMLVIGALLLNNAVGGALYRTPPARPQVCEDVLVAQEAAAETERELSQNVISADYLASTGNVQPALRKQRHFLRDPAGG